MCFDYDGTCDIYDHTQPKARKEYRCGECGRTIARGEQYHRAEGLYDGKWFTEIWCSRCEAVRQKIHDHEIAEGCTGAEAWPPHGGLREALLESDGYGLVEYGRGERPGGWSSLCIVSVAEEAKHLVKA